MQVVPRHCMGHNYVKKDFFKYKIQTQRGVLYVCLLNLTTLAQKGVDGYQVLGGPLRGWDGEQRGTPGVTLECRLKSEPGGLFCVQSPVQGLLNQVDLGLIPAC